MQEVVTNQTSGKMATNYRALHKKAHQAGLSAAREKAKNVRPMVVQQHTNPLNDNSTVTKEWVVPGGPCGFAWVGVDGRSGFARWAKKELGARKDHYRGGVSFFVHEFGQSFALKDAYARAYANVLREMGVKGVRVGSRLD